MRLLTKLKREGKTVDRPEYAIQNRRPDTEICVDDASWMTPGNLIVNPVAHEHPVSRRITQALIEASYARRPGEAVTPELEREVLRHAASIRRSRRQLAFRRFWSRARLPLCLALYAFLIGTLAKPYADLLLERVTLALLGYGVGSAAVGLLAGLFTGSRLWHGTWRVLRMWQEEPCEAYEGAKRRSNAGAWS